MQRIIKKTFGTLAALTLLCACHQERAHKPTDAEKYELKGAVKELEISYYAENDELGEAVKDLRNKLAITFDKEGRQVKETFYEITADAQGKTIAVVASIARTAYDGDVKEVVAYTPDGVQTAKRVFLSDKNGTTIFFDDEEVIITGTAHVKKDTQGRIAERYWQSELGSIEVTFAYKYDAQGNVSEITVSDSMGRHYRTYRFAYDSKGNETEVKSFDRNNKLWAESLYDKKGNLLKTSIYDKEGNLTATAYEYDRKGNVTEELWNLPADKGEQRNTYTYDRKGNLVKANIESVGVVYTYEYDDKDNVSQMVSTDNATKSSETYRYTYTYDEKGNYTRKTERSSKDFKATEERVIRYY
jgi:rhs family protein